MFFRPVFLQKLLGPQKRRLFRVPIGPIRAFKDTPGNIRFFSSSILGQAEVEQRVLKVLNAFEKVDQSKLSIDSDFTQIGLDSLDVVEVMIALEDEFHVEIPDNVADTVNNPKDVAVFLFKTLNPEPFSGHKEPKYSED